MRHLGACVVTFQKVSKFRSTCSDARADASTRQPGWAKLDDPRRRVRAAHLTARPRRKRGLGEVAHLSGSGPDAYAREHAAKPGAPSIAVGIQVALWPDSGHSLHTPVTLPPDKTPYSRHRLRFHLPSEFTCPGPTWTRGKREPVPMHDLRTSPVRCRATSMTLEQNMARCCDPEARHCSTTACPTVGRRERDCVLKRAPGE